MEREDADRHEAAGQGVVPVMCKKRDAGLACEGIPFPVAVSGCGIEPERRRRMADHGLQFAATPTHALRRSHEPVVMFDDQHGNGAAEQVLDMVQRIAVMGKPWRTSSTPCTNSQN